MDVFLSILFGRHSQSVQPLASEVQGHNKTINVDKLSSFHPAFNSVAYARIADLYLKKWGNSLGARQNVDRSLKAVKTESVCYDWAKSSEPTPVTEHQAFPMVTKVCNEMTSLFDGLQIEFRDKKYNVSFSAEPLHTFYQRNVSYKLGPTKPHITVFINLVDPGDEVNSVYLPLMTLHTEPISSCCSAAAKVLFGDGIEIEHNNYNYLQDELERLFKKTGAGVEARTKSAEDRYSDFLKTLETAASGAAAAARTGFYGITDGISLTLFCVTHSEPSLIDNNHWHTTWGVHHVVDAQALMLFRALLSKVWQRFKIIA